MSDLKTSVLINRQIPEYIREEYPAFIAFVEASPSAERYSRPNFLKMPSSPLFVTFRGFATAAASCSDWLTARHIAVEG